MAAGGLAVEVLEADLVELLVVVEDAVVEEVLGAAADVVQLDSVLLHVEDLLLLGRVADVAARGGVETDVVEGVGIVLGDGEGVAAAHGEAGDGAAFFLGDGAVVGIDEGDDLREGINEVGFSGEGVAVGVSVSVVGGCGLLGGVAVGHDQDHRLGLALGDEVVEDLRGAAEVKPGVLVTGVAMEEVEDGIFLLAALLVPRRGIDVDATSVAEGLAVIPAGGDGAVGDVVDSVNVAPVAFLLGNDEIVHPARDVLDDGIVEVHDGGAVHCEAVEIEFGSQGLGGVGPDSVGFLELGGTLHELSGDLDLDGLGVLVAEGYAVVGVDYDSGEDFLRGGRSLAGPERLAAGPHLLRVRARCDEGQSGDKDNSLHT